MSELRKNILNEAHRIVVKIGSRILVDSEKGGVRTRYIQKLADSVARLMEAGKEVVIVTSGAVGTGMSQLGYKEKPTVIAEKQACAAVGQIDLMYAYREMFRWCQLSVGQILLSAEDFRDRNRYKNLQNTIKAMLTRKIVPIINENDSLAVAEIKVGDNDKLSSDVALFLDADLLLIFTDEDGLFDDNPKKNPNARLLRFVPEITPAVLALAGKPGEAGSAVSTGGMRSKLEAIRNVTKSGCNAFLACGMRVLPHEVILEQAEGTLFVGSKKKLNSRQRWLSFITTPRGSVVVDEGGVKALREKHSSLLPVGVVSVKKHFDKGDLIEVLCESGEAVARGVAKFDSETLKLVLHKKTAEIHALLGKDVADELVHKNDLVVF
ncbi:MAG: glutamate 5-kinase [Fibrobacter sp.]|nr:glutamate 5-kinase [Fibrobacter sp.]